MPRYNHTRGDGPYSPCLICQVEKAMEDMGVDTVGRMGDPIRWSRTDFITDLADFIQPYPRGTDDDDNVSPCIVKA